MKGQESLLRHKGISYMIPFALISTLFFLWGFAHSILEVLNPHFQASFAISKTMAASVQAAVYGGYFLMALPAGFIIRRWGYRIGVLTGLLLYGIGALLFIPGSFINSFTFFVFSLFIVGCGLTCLETSANPYVTVLGAPSEAERRINLAQSLNGLGWIIGPLVGGALLFSGADIAIPYAIVGTVVLIAAIVFSRLKLPEIADQAEEAQDGGKGKLWNIPFTLGVVALFLYVAAQTGINSFFINYIEENVGIPRSEAARWLGFGGMGLFTFGRLTGSWLMYHIRAARLLSLYALLAAISTAVIVWCSGMVTLIAFLIVYLTESIMFPTIFSLSLRSSHGNVKQASSILIMTIVGGVFAPLLMGAIADSTGQMGIAFIVPMVCFIYILLYSSITKK